MKAIVEIVTGAFMIAAVVLVAGVTVEPIAAVVLSSDAVQSLGWGSTVRDTRTVLLRWSILLGLLFFIVWGTLYTIRKTRTTTVKQ